MGARQSRGGCEERAERRGATGVSKSSGSGDSERLGEIGALGATGGVGVRKNRGLGNSERLVMAKGAGDETGSCRDAGAALNGRNAQNRELGHLELEHDFGT